MSASDVVIPVEGLGKKYALHHVTSGRDTALRNGVAAGENLRRVLELIRQVAETMREEPEWADSMVGTPEVLGVDEVRQSGCLIRVWIQTLPLAQWPVGREFRLRVKEAFDREGIRLGLPRQEVVLNTALKTSTSP